MFDQKRFLYLTDIFDRILSLFRFLVLNILEMIDFVRIRLFEHLYDMFQSFIDTEMGRCRNRKGMLRQKFFRDFGSDIFGFEIIAIRKNNEGKKLKENIQLDRLEA